MLAISHETVEMKEPAVAPGETGHAYVDPGAWDTPNHWFFGDEKNAPKRVKHTLMWANPPTVSNS